MQSFAARGLVFDAKRVSAETGMAEAEVAQLLDEHFWNGALVAFGYRRQERTGLPALFSRHAGEPPGVSVEGPPADPRAPEHMPVDWIVEAPGVLFREGSRLSVDPAWYSDAAIADLAVRVTWKRSPNARFNIVDGIRRRDVLPPSTECTSLGQVVHVDPGLRGVTVRNEKGDLAVPLAGTEAPWLGEVVLVTWERRAPGYPFEPARVRRLDVRVREWFPRRWWATLEQHLSGSLQDYKDVADELDGWDAPLELIAVDSEPTLYSILSTIDDHRDPDEPAWIFHYDFKEPPIEDVLERLGLPDDLHLGGGPRSPDGEDAWTVAISRAAEARGLSERVYAVKGDGDNRTVVILEPDRWETLRRLGCLSAADDGEVRPRTLDEARACLLPGWDDDCPFDDAAAMKAFFTSPRGQLVDTGETDLLRLDLPIEDIHVSWSSWRGGSFVAFNLSVSDAETPEDTMAVSEAIWPPVAIEQASTNVDLAIYMPLEGLSPRRALSAMQELYACWEAACAALE
jgi:hypothetical protein